jgi:hypothetical protein
VIVAVLSQWSALFEFNYPNVIHNILFFLQNGK